MSKDLHRMFEQEARRAGFTIRKVRGIDHVPVGLLEEVLREVKAHRTKPSKNGKQRAANG